jgi:ornithine cyclodeaminase/alanine dehydrogenase-like protein (mu-crystallin family)
MWSGIHELADVVVGNIKGRKSENEITLLESQGIAIGDMAAANFVYRQAKEQGLGVELPMDS